MKLSTYSQTKLDERLTLNFVEKIFYSARIFYSSVLFIRRKKTSAFVVIIQMVIHTDFSQNCEIQTMRWTIKTDNKGCRLTWSGVRNKWSAQAIAHDLGSNGPGEVTARVMPWAGVSLYVG